MINVLFLHRSDMTETTIAFCLTQRDNNHNLIAYLEFLSRKTTDPEKPDNNELN